MARIRRPRVVCCTSRSAGVQMQYSGSASRLLGPRRTTFTQGPFAPGALPPLLALTGPCADPTASRSTFGLPSGERPCRLRSSTAGQRDRPDFALPFYAGVLRPLCRRLARCTRPVLPWATTAFTYLLQARLSSAIPHKTASRGWCISARQAFLDVAALQLARPPDRSAPLTPHPGTCTLELAANSLPL